MHTTKLLCVFFTFFYAFTSFFLLLPSHLSFLISHLSLFTFIFHFSHILIKGVILASIDEGQCEFEIFVKMGKISWKSFGDSKNSRTFASAFRARPL